MSENGISARGASEGNATQRPSAGASGWVFDRARRLFRQSTRTGPCRNPSGWFRSDLGCPSPSRPRRVDLVRLAPQRDPHEQCRCPASRPISTPSRRKTPRARRPGAVVAEGGAGAAVHAGCIVRCRQATPTTINCQAAKAAILAKSGPARFRERGGNRPDDDPVAYPAIPTARRRPTRRPAARPSADPSRRRRGNPSP